MKKFDLAIIGAGAAGCMAGITAAANKKSVILIEKNNIIARKILATGNGRCNLTNKNMDSSHYHGTNPEFIDTVIQKFNQNLVMDFFESLGIILKEEARGRIFPRNNQAESIKSVLEYELKKNNVKILFNSPVKRIEKNHHWKIKLADEQEITSDKLIIACGGKAAHQFGSSGDGYFWVEKLGHKIVEVYPALVPLETKETWVKDVQGIKVEGKVILSQNDLILHQSQGDILFTHFGLSGPAIMAQARFVGPLIDKNIKIHLNLFPELTRQMLDDKIKHIFETNGAKFVKNCLSGIVPANLALVILANVAIDRDKKAASISKAERKKITNYLKNVELTPKRLLSFKEAQTTRGGVCVDQINPQSMESKIIAGLYFAGEIVDVDGDSGGYNLQWAWSSGHLAGMSAAS